MSQKPQFEHKIRGFSGNSRGIESTLRQRRAPSYNAVLAACACVTGWNGVSVPGLVGRSMFGAAESGGLERATVRQMEILR
jgi:hypothetical protein